MNPDHGPIREALAKNSEGGSIVGIVEGRSQDGGVCDVEVCITGGQADAVKVERPGHREVDHLDALSLESLAVLGERSVVHVLRIVFPAQHHRSRTHKATDVIDVTVRIVTRDAFAQPQRVRHAECVAQHRLDVLTSEPGVAHLHVRTEQAFFGREQSAAPIDVDAPAFEHHLGVDQRQLESLRRQLGNPVVLLPILVLGPRVEVKARDGEQRLRAGGADEDRPGIPGPAPVRREAQKVDAGEIHADLLENSARMCLLDPGVDEDTHHLTGCQMTDDLAVHPRDGRKLARPVARVMRPGEPGRRMPLPLGRHAIERRISQ